MTKKSVIILTAIILGIFAIINLVWFLGVGVKYLQYGRGMEKNGEADGSSIKYSKVVDGYSYQIKPSLYLGFESGFLVVSKVDERSIYEVGEGDEAKVYYTDENGEEQYIEDYYEIDFYYWTRAFDQSRYGIMYWSPELDAQILLDRDLNVQNGKETEYHEIFQETVDEHRDEIQDLMNRAEEMWGLEF